MAWWQRPAATTSHALPPSSLLQSLPSPTPQLSSRRTPRWPRRTPRWPRGTPRWPRRTPVSLPLVGQMPGQPTVAVGEAPSDLFFCSLPRTAQPSSRAWRWLWASCWACWASRARCLAAAKSWPMRTSQPGTARQTLSSTCRHGHAALPAARSANERALRCGVRARCGEGSQLVRELRACPVTVRPPRPRPTHIVFTHSRTFTSPCSPAAQAKRSAFACCNQRAVNCSAPAAILAHHLYLHPCAWLALCFACMH